MYLIAGLGNPEQDYSKTRHNMGFNVVNEISKKYEIDITKKGYDALYGKGIINDTKVILLKPQTYMNLSGISIKKCMEFYKIPIENLIVIYDDIDIEPGSIRIRKFGGPGTHNGLKSVVHELCTEKFSRVRVGIGKPKEDEDLISYVVGHISEEDQNLLNTGIDKAAKAVIELITNGIESAMNSFN